MSRTRASSSSSNADFSKRIQEAEHDSKALLGVLESLKKEKMTVEGMVRGGLGKTINKLRKHEDAKVASLAKEIIKNWKGLFKQTQSQGKRPREEVSGGNAGKKQKIFAKAEDIAEDSTKEVQALLKWLSETENTKSAYDVEEKVNPTRVRIVDSNTFVKEYPEQLDIGAKAKVKPLKIKHPRAHRIGAKGPIVYWMSRDQRSEDNWALLYAQQLASANEVGLVVIFNLVPTFLEATKRQYGFMLRGLTELQGRLEQKNIPLKMLYGDPQDTIPEFLEKYACGALVADFSPMRIAFMWKSQVFSKLQDIPFYEVDAHNVVPVWQASNKLEYGARTIRRRIHSQLETYLTRFPKLKEQEEDLLPADLQCGKNEKISFKKLVSTGHVKVDKTVEEVKFCEPGEFSAQKVYHDFIANRVKIYETSRNDPTKPGALSGLSPYLHFGQLSAQRAILEAFEAKRRTKHSNISKGLDGFIEECLVRRELSDNFCFHNPNYDKIDGCWNWARTTHKEHWDDKRSKLYSREQLEEAKTHDNLWNAAQLELVKHGKMHGFMRMYWAKKIMEWTETPKVALEEAIYLNDRYSIDGRDPNGYVGCMWSIAGVHDQGWSERPVFGKIRYMTYDGCKRKFNIAAYVNRIKRLLR